MLELKITANNKDEKMKIERALKADNAFMCLSEIMSSLRKIIKYEEKSEETYERFWKFREEVQDIMNDEAIDLDYYFN